MKRTSSRIICLLLCALMLCSMLPVSAFAAEVTDSGTCGDDLTWVLTEDGTLTVSGTGSMKNFSETDDGAPWKNHRDSILSVVVEEGVTSVGSGAFAVYKNLREVTLPNGLTSIGNEAFWYCDSLNKIDLSNGLASIGESAFENCDSLTEIALPDSLTSIGVSAFDNCDSLNKIDFSDDLTSIRNYAFRDCSSLTDIVLPDSLTFMGIEAFSTCDSLTTIDLPDSLTSLGDAAFSYCKSLTEVNLPDSVTSINHAFGACSSLTGIYVSENNPNFSNDEYGVLFNKDKTVLIAAPGAIAPYSVPTSVVSLAEYAFWGCNGLTEIDLPDSLTSIDEYAFLQCNNLTTIDLPAGLTFIGDDAFFYCESLQELRFRGDAPGFGTGVFYDVTATAYYPEGNPTWTEDVMQDYGGTITWVAYNPGHAHTYTAKTTAPTCTEKGYTTYTCDCGHSYTDDEVDALGHDFEKGTCTRCDEADPNYQEKKVEFTLKEDNFSFTNSASDFYNGIFDEFGANLGKKRMEISENSLNQLLYGMDATVRDKVYDDIKNWGGSCFGMSLVMAIRSADENRLPIGSIIPEDSSVTNTYGLPEPKDHDTVRDLVNYYQLLQFLPYFYDKLLLSTHHRVETDYDAVLQDLLCKITDDEVPVVLSMCRSDTAGKAIGCHAVIALEILEETEEYYVLKVYDPNRQKFTELILYREDAHSSVDKNGRELLGLRISYYSSQNAGASSNEYTQVIHYIDDLEIMDLKNYFNPDHDRAIEMGGTSYGLPILFVNSDGNLWLRKEDGTIMLVCEDGMVKDTQNVYGPFMVPGEIADAENPDPEYQFIVDTEQPDARYTIEVSEQEEDSILTMIMPSWKIDASGASEMTITMDNVSESVKLESPTAGDLSANIVWNEQNAVPYESVTVTAGQSTEMNLAPAEGGVLVTGDNLSDVTISTGIGDERQFATTSDETSLMITEKDGELAVCEDSDGDGTYENELDLREVTPIRRIYGDTRYETAYAVANELKAVLGVEKFDTIIVACGSNFPDALSGSYLAAIKDAPILLAKTNNDALLAYIQENLSKDGLVYILGSDVVVSKAFEDSLKAENIKVERLAGATRYLTSLAILEEAGITRNEILISTSMNYADSLSASSTGLPILLINNSRKDLTAEQKEFLAQRDSWRFYILGSEAAVCAEFEDVLGDYGDVERVYGDVRESTSIAIAKAFCKAPENMVLAYSQDFPDGLCGGVLAYNLNAPLVLARTSEKIEKLVGEYVQEYGIAQGIVLGSSKLISDETVTTIFQQ